MGYDAIFVGTVTELISKRESAGNRRWISGYVMRFSVDEALRGTIGTEVLVRTGNGGGDCGMPLKPGSRFLIFAYKDEDGELSTGICSGNQRAPVGPEGEAVVAPLRELAKKETGSIFGMVTQARVQWQGDDVKELQVTPTGYVLLDASGAGSAQAISRPDGSYRFDSLLPGTYTITPRLPAGWDMDREYEDRYTVQVAPGSCEHVGFQLRPSTRIKGRVVFPPGASDKGVTVIAIPASMNVESKYSGAQDFALDKDGRFDIWPLPPGEYFVGVNITSSPSADEPFPPTYYPGVTLKNAAQVVHLSQGQVKDLELVIPQIAEPRQIRFTALGPNGKPMRKVYIQLEDLRIPGDAASYVNVELDDKGRGELTVYSGYSYHLHASHFISNREDWCAKPVLIPAGSKPLTVKFVMESKSDGCSIREMDAEEGLGK
jgi:hypothetical protein